MIKISNQKIIDICQRTNDIFFEPRSKFLYEIKYFGGGFYYVPIMKYSYKLFTDI